MIDQPADWVTAYSYVRMAMPRGSRITTDDDGQEVTFTATRTLGGRTVATRIYVRHERLQDPTWLRNVAAAMAARWEVLMPQRVHTTPRTGKVLLGHPDDIETLQDGAAVARIPYMTARHAKRGEVLIMDCDAINGWIGDWRRDAYSLFHRPSSFARITGLTA